MWVFYKIFFNIKQNDNFLLEDSISFYITWCTVIENYQEVVYDSWANLFLSFYDYNKGKDFMLEIIDKTNTNKFNNITEEERWFVSLIDNYDFCNEPEPILLWKKIKLDIETQQNKDVFCKKINKNYISIKNSCNKLKTDKPKTTYKTDDNWINACNLLYDKASYIKIKSLITPKKETLFEYIDINFPVLYDSYNYFKFVWKWNVKFSPNFKKWPYYYKKWSPCTYLLDNNKILSDTCFSVLNSWEWVMTKDGKNKAYILLTQGQKRLIWKFTNNKFKLFWYSKQNVFNPVISTSWKVLYSWTNEKQKRLYLDRAATLQDFEDILYYDFFPNSDSFFFVWKKINKYNFIVCK